MQSKLKIHGFACLYIWHLSGSHHVASQVKSVFEVPVRLTPCIALHDGSVYIVVNAPEGGLRLNPLTKAALFFLACAKDAKAAFMAQLLMIESCAELVLISSHQPSKFCPTVRYSQQGLHIPDGQGAQQNVASIA